MPDKEALEQRLEKFRNAGRNLQLQPLLTQEEFDRLGVEYAAETLDELESAIEDSEPNSKYIFTGHRGCGKSTLLAGLKRRLDSSDRYFIVLFSIAKTIELSAVDRINILFSIAIQLLEMSENEKIDIQPEIKKNLYDWLAKHTKTEVRSRESNIEVSGSAEVSGGIPLFLKLLAAIKATLKTNSVIREEITQEFSRKIEDLIDKVNEIKTYIETETGKQILVIIDDLDKLDLSVTEEIFSKNIQPLLQPDFKIIYTISISTLREVSLKSNLESSFSKIYIMPVTKFFSRDSVRNDDRQPNDEYMQVFREVLVKRLPKGLVADNLREEIIIKSGGVMRELARIADRCCNKCMQAIRKNIRHSQYDLPDVIVDREILDSVLNDLKIEYSTPLGIDDYNLLRDIYDKLKPQNAEDRRFLDFLHGLYILEYRNASLWYDLHPIVFDLLRSEQVIL
jgi:energy-coupling factor transporter ATP-binding protein EcfA2